MSSSSNPLNPHPQDAHPGHNASSSVGSVQRAASKHGVDHGMDKLISLGYVPTRQLTGKVTSIWGEAHIQHPNGEVRVLHVGDVVKKGDVVLTAQDGIVQIDTHFKPGTGDDVERIISQVGRGDADVVPAAGPTTGGAAGSLEEGLRVGRDAEAVSPLAMEFGPPPAPVEPPVVPTLLVLTPPAANPDVESTPANTPVSFDPRTNDTSTTAITIVAINTQPIDVNTPVTLPNGVVAMNPDGTLTFTPTHGFNGSLTFTYTDQNAAGGTATSTVTIGVGAPAPAAAPDTFAGMEDKPITGTLAANDTPSSEGGNVWSIVTGPSHGPVTINPDGTFTYVPDPHYSGTDTFTYKITDADGTTSTATVTLNVAPVPLAAPDTFSGHEGSPITGTVATNDTPSDDHTTTWHLSTGPNHGTVTVNTDGTFTYTPTGSYTGPDTFTYTITDGAGSSSTATVSLNVTPVPLAVPDVFSGHENAPITGNLAGNDAPSAGETNTWTVANPPTHGTVTVNPDGTFSYVPTTNFSGPDSFTYTITDGAGLTSTATVTVKVAPVPLAAPDTLSGTENQPITGSVATNDTPDGVAPNIWTVAHGPDHGTLTLHPDGTFSYVPATNYSGPDSFTYTVTDGSGASSTATVSLNVTPVPLAADDTNSGHENTAISGSVATNDTPDAVGTNVWAVATGAAHGTVVLHADGSYVYTPATGFSGTDSFTYTVTDGAGAKATATVTLNVDAVGPAAVPDTSVVPENSSVKGDVSTNDTQVPGEANVFTVATPPVNGHVDFHPDGTYTYTPTIGFTGTDTFTYTITDTAGETSTATVTLTVTPVAPVALPDTNVVTENGTVNGDVSGNDTKVAGETPIFTVGTPPAHGTLDFHPDGTYTYTPTVGYNGPDTFTYAITDGSGTSSTASVTLSVTPLSPTAAPDLNSTPENSPVSGNVATNDQGVTGESSTFALGTAPTHGGVEFHADGSYVYTPTTGFTGTDTFTYSIIDASGHSSTATVTLSVTPLDLEAVPDTNTLVENTSVGGDVSINDGKVAGEINTFTLGSPPAHGGVVFHADGTYTYTPTVGYNGPDSFTYSVQDTAGQTSTATVTLTVTPLIPVAAPDTAVVADILAGVSGNLGTNDTPVAGEASTWAIDPTHQPAHGVAVVNPDGTYTYTPTVGYNGPDSFQYTVTDASGHSSTSTVTLTVTPLSPVAAPDTAVVAENSPAGVSGNLGTNDTPVAGEASTWAIDPTHQPAHGVAVVNPDGTYTYTPTVGYNGPDSFQYTVTDASGHSSTSTVTLTVTPLVPIANADVNSVAENASVNGSVGTNDLGIAGEASTFALGTLPTHGAVVFHADGTYTYTPTVGFSGTDTFTYSLTDTTGHSSTATVTLTVVPLGLAAVPDVNTVVENTVVSGDVSTNDGKIAGETNTFTLGTPPAHGGVVFHPDGTYTYTPTVGFNGTDTFTYSVKDTAGETSTATVTLTVTPITPVAAPDPATVVENSPTGVSGNLGTNDTPVAGEASTWAIDPTHLPAHGTAVVHADGTYTYVPTVGYNGTDSFQYTITDASGHSSTSTVTLTVTPLVPIANADANTVAENTAAGVNGNVGANDAGIAGEASTFTLGTSPTHGAVAFHADGTYTYTPTTGFSGTDSFTYTLTDTTGHSSTATVTLTVTPLNPVAAPDTNTVVENTAAGVSGNLGTNDTKVAGEATTWAIDPTHLPTHGTAVVHADGTYTYVPTVGYNGTDSFQYTITDASGHSSTSTVTLTVTPLVPIANADANTVAENTAAGVNGNVGANDAGVAGEASTFTLGTSPTHGAVAFHADGTYTYTPTTGFSGTDSFTYTLTDTTGHSSTATVTLTVTPLNPVAAPDTNTVVENTAAGVSGNLATNDTKVAGEATTWAIDPTHLPTHGTAVVHADGTYTYVPTVGYNGTDSFQYTITDASGHSSTSTVTLTVTPINPVAAPDTNTVVENTAAGVSGNLGTNDTSVAGEVSTWAIDPTHLPAHGTATVHADGTYTYVPTTGYNGTDSFQYTITDASGHSSTSTVTLTVTPINPVAAPDTNTVVENTAAGVSGNLGTNDTPVAGEVSTWAIDPTHLPAHGTATVHADGTYTYVPTTGYNGTDSFQYTITDASGHSSTSTVTLTVTPINPVAAPDTNTVVENTAAGVSGNLGTNDTKVAGESTSWAIDPTHLPAHGTAVVNADGTYTYTPTGGYSGTDSFQYTITDGSGHSSTSTVTLTVTPLIPVAAPDTNTVVENTAAGVSGNLGTNDTKVAGETTTWAIDPTHLPTHGTAVVNTDGTYTYTPTVGYNGPDSFQYTITDGSGHSSTSTVTLTVTPLNPIAAADAFTVNENSTLTGQSVLTNDTAVAGETNSWSVATQPTHGTLTPAANFSTTGNFTYTPTTGYVGTDTFTYTVIDGSGHASTATATITVNPIAPAALNDAFEVFNTATVLNSTVTGNDTPVAGETNTWAVVAGHSTTHGTLTMQPNGTFVYTPTAGYAGTDTFTYTVTDTHGQASTATATITVDPHAPTLTQTDKVYALSTDFEVPLLGTSTYQNDAVGSLVTHQAGATWQTDNVGNTVEIGLTSTYGASGDTTQVIELEQNLNDASNLYTNLATRQGEVYSLSFDYAARGNNAAATNSIVYVYWEGQLVDTINTANTAMTHYTLELISSTTGTGQLEFIAGDSNSYGGMLDNVALTLKTDTGVQGYVVNLPSITSALTDTVGTESLHTVISAIPVGTILTDGAHTFTSATGTTETSVDGWSLSTLAIVPPSATTGDVTLTVTATATESTTGHTATSTENVTVHVQADTANVYGTTGNDTLATTAAGNDIRWGLDGNDTITGGSGNDTLEGGSGNDRLVAGSGNTVLEGGTGNDVLIGGAGADTLSGGQGNDTLTGGGGVDVFKWHLGDQGTTATPAVDTITDFNKAAVSAGGDVLDLRDLLHNETRPTGTTGAGDLTNYLHFTFDAVGGNTTIHVYTEGNFGTGGTDSQQIVLTGVNLVGTSTDAQIITDLLNNGKLMTNGH